MVDFQSRDTSRGSTDDEDDGDGEDENEDEETEPDSASPETGDETGSTDRPEGQDRSGSSGDDGQDATQEHGTGTGHEHSHAHGHADVGHLGVAVVTVSSTRTRENDSSGDAIVSSVEADDHEVVTRDVVGDDLDGIQRTVLALTGRDDVDVVVTTGGTGVTPDDVTVEAVSPLFDKTLPGFGELFRIRSYEEVGTRAMGSRATAGISEGVPVFCLPGSEDAVRLGMAELVTEEVEHLVALATRQD